MHRTTIYLPRELKGAIEGQALAEGVTEAEVIRRAVTEHLAQTSPPAPHLPLFPAGLGVDLVSLLGDDL